MKSVMKIRFVMPPMRGPRKAALSKLPNRCVGAAGVVSGEMFTHIVMYTNSKVPDAGQLRIAGWLMKFSTNPLNKRRFP